MNARDALIVSDGADRRELAIAALSEDAVKAISAVIAAHEDEFIKAAGQEGVDWKTVLQPEWYRAVTFDDAQAAVERGRGRT